MHITATPLNFGSESICGPGSTYGYCLFCGHNSVRLVWPEIYAQGGRIAYRDYIWSSGNLSDRYGFQASHIRHLVGLRLFRKLQQNSLLSCSRYGLQLLLRLPSRLQLAYSALLSSKESGKRAPWSSHKRLQPVNMSASTTAQIVFAIGYDFTWGMAIMGTSGIFTTIAIAHAIRALIMTL